MSVGVACRVVAADEAPQDVGRLGVHHAGQVQQHGEGQRRVRFLRHAAGMDVPGRVDRAVRLGLAVRARRIGQVFVHRPGNHVEIQPLGALRLVEHELRQAFRRGVAQPFLHRQPVAAAFADLLRLLVEEQFVGEAGGRLAAEDAADPAGQAHAVDQVLARHFVIDAERMPAHRPVGLPLQFGAAAGDRGFESFARIGVAPENRAGSRGRSSPPSPA